MVGLLLVNVILYWLFLNCIWTTVTIKQRVVSEDDRNLVTEQSSFAADDLFKDLFADMWVHSAQRVI